MTDTCNSCAFARTRSNDPDVTYLACALNAPVANGDTVTAWPAVQATDWCGKGIDSVTGLPFSLGAALTITLNSGASFGLNTPGAMTLGSTYTIGTTGDNLRFNGLGLGVAAPTNAGQISQTLGANNVTGTTITRNTDTGPTGKFVDYLNAAAGSLWTVDITGTLTVGTWSGTKIGLAYGGTNADLSATGGASNYLKQSSAGAAITVGTIPASDIASVGALTRVSDTNVTLTLGGSPTTALLAATSLTLGWTGTLGLSRGGTNADLSATGGTSQVLKQTGVGSAVTVGQVSDADLSTTDVTTNNVTTAKHGFAPKAPNSTSQFLRGDASYAAVSDANLSTTDITTNDVSSTKHGFAPKAPADATQFLNGATTPAFAVPPGVSYRNILNANGGCEIWQRGSGDTGSFAVAASTTAYTLDRWYITTGATQASTVGIVAGLTNQSQWAASVQRNSAQNGTTAMVFAYPLTKEECIRLRGQKFALQFYTSTGANWSPTSGTLTYNVYFGTGAEGKRGAGFTGETNPLTGSVNLAQNASAAQTTANSGSTTVATNVTQGELRFTWTPTGTAGAGDYFTLDDVQLEMGTTNSTFERPSIAQMFLECQRHYCKTFPYNTAPAQSAGLVGAISRHGLATNTVIHEWRFLVPMRTSPTITTYNPSAAAATWRNFTASTSPAVTVDPDTAKSADTVPIQCASVTTVGDHIYIHAQADAGL